MTNPFIELYHKCLVSMETRDVYTSMSEDPRIDPPLSSYLLLVCCETTNRMTNAGIARDAHYLAIV